MSHIIMRIYICHTVMIRLTNVPSLFVSHLAVNLTSDKILIVRVLAKTTSFQFLKFESPFNKII